jgi:hypothetical protein
MDKKTTEVLEKARHLMSIEGSYVPLSGESLQNQTEIEKACQAHKLELELKRHLADEDALSIPDPKVREYLSRVNQGTTETEFRSHLYLLLSEKGLLPVPIENHDVYGGDDEDWGVWRERMDEIIDLAGFKLRSEEIGTLIIGQNVPPFINRQLARLKTCYRLGLDDVAVVFCRALLEAALVEALRSVEDLHHVQGKVVDRDTWRMAALLKRAESDPVIKARIRRPDRIDEIKKDAGRVLHSKEPGELKLSTSVEKIIEDTYSIIGALFES